MSKYIVEKYETFNKKYQRPSNRNPILIDKNGLKIVYDDGKYELHII